jgi:hypothetical protein
MLMRLRMILWSQSIPTRINKQKFDAAPEKILTLL